MKLPFIIIVDDDEHVLRAIQRDVRNEYRDAYRVSATDSAKEALELVKELKLKNETVALFISDQRMPEMEGVAFLAWDQFIYSLKKEWKKDSEPDEENAVPELPSLPFSSSQERKITWFSRYRWVMPLVVFGIVAGAIWKIYLPLSPIPVASVDRMKYPLPDHPSIAVLPFTNMSEDPGQEFLSDGITESIITALSRVPGIFVIARNSTFAYKGKLVKVKQVNEEFGVRYVLEGSVQKSADRIRINAQMVDALTGHHIWAEKYDRDLKNIFALRDEFTMKIITALQVKLTAGEMAHLMAKGTKNIDAYIKFLQGINLMSTKEGNAQARKILEEAITLDPEYSRLYTAQAFTHLNDVWYGTTGSSEESLARAFELAQKAISFARGR